MRTIWCARARSRRRSTTGSRDRWSRSKAGCTVQHSGCADGALSHFCRLRAEVGRPRFDTLRVMAGKKWVGVFYASAAGASAAYLQAAGELGRRIAEAGHGLVYGGATVGGLGAVAG